MGLVSKYNKPLLIAFFNCVILTSKPVKLVIFIFPGLQMRKLRLEKILQLAQSQRMVKWLSSDSMPGWSV